MRIDFDVLKQWIPPSTRVLDLGCGSGSLLAALADEKQVQGYGIEIDADKIARCIERRVNVIEQNLDAGLGNFDDGSFDTVVMSQTLQAVRYPHTLVLDMLRVGRECIVSFPNFGHWRCRLQVVLRGRMPVSHALPYTWYNTPNIHLCTVRDFEDFCRDKHIQIRDRRFISAGQNDNRLSVLWPNMLCDTAIYRLSR